MVMNDYLIFLAVWFALVLFAFYLNREERWL